MMPEMPVLFVVDDEPDLVEILGELLESKGAKVFRFTDAKRAFDFIPELTPDLIVTDFVMPGMDGMELLKTTRQFYVYVPGVLFITGQSGKLTPSELKHFGAIDVFEKPMDIDAVWNSIQKFITTTPVEKQRYFRTVCDLEAHIEGASATRASNLGYGGVFIECEKDVQKPGGAMISFSLKIDGGTVKGHGNVMWVRDEVDGFGNKPGMGIKFSKIEDEGYDRVLDYVRVQRLSHSSS